MIEEQLENHLHEGEEEHMHTHVLEDGTTVMHSHGEHGHHHSHAQTKAVLNRLSRAIGTWNPSNVWWKTAGIAAKC